jgi:hypothetical protein
MIKTNTVVGDYDDKILVMTKTDDNSLVMITITMTVVGRR